MGRRKNKYYYLAVIAVLFFFTICTLHNQLQVELYKSHVEIQNEAGYIEDKLVHSDSVTKKPVMDKRSNLSKTIIYKDKNIIKYKEVVSSCFLSPETNELKFQTVAEDTFYVYSAYLDRRLPDHYIRIMSLLNRNLNKNLDIVCYLRGDNNEYYPVTAVKYVLAENHDKKYGGWLISCPIPEDFFPCQVTVSANLKAENKTLRINNITMNLIDINPANARFDYTVCVPPLYGDFLPHKLIEFMEFTKYFGAEKFIIYHHDIQNHKSRKAFKYYSDQVTVIQWKLPGEIDLKLIKNHGQPLAHMDCLYRAMSITDKLVIQDIDELIVPHDKNLFWKESLSPLFNKTVIGIRIQSAFFYNCTSQGDVVALSCTTRTQMYSRSRTKVIIKPSAVLEVGIHHVSKPLVEEYRVIVPDPWTVLLHHYRRCSKMFGMNCKNWVRDETMIQKYSAVKNRILQVKHKI
ncbi:beta-1,4-galactosyltransferase galt-1-like [Mytilus californianus]|uniref:beta-1,4-galactosyltransferase galt-1-like n=1 Tax=Mytilus californianus TaxID=6549 RepID=UPI002247035D|nr:beta-1,4-galactosyltransferase galt-1-like [Mytilus californianus]XP_052061473.1 beta-1,4-galactosyltransferase galt-1-like [Mytilus californianus]XP_052061474.1 beta-1,4-galactosyltransferase galt-1-like [Mytilus californianus]XP_052061475.1 beta-1,4-galactosyltransferase galt-1-like [Mytilus californianus]XP_052061476.1 beta-1,4-galactosyltransferase galt-1-like [Mytilus californianus]XP_052061477.1 beta-1,4-galactosyltransferase galt-1-like [Mytilus californianus]XP_052061478.1 beta-1,4